MAAGSALLGAILGASFAGWRASLAAAGSASAQSDEMDTTLRQASPQFFGTSVTAVLQGAFIGGIIGLLLMIGIMVLLNIERVRPEREFDDPEG